MNFSSFVFPLSVTLTNFKNSDSWDSTYTTVRFNSSGWESVETQVRSLSDSWEESAIIEPLQAASGYWNSVFSTVQVNSASWEESAEIIPTVTTHLATNNILISSLRVILPYKLATPQAVAGTGVRFFSSVSGGNYLVDTRTAVVSTMLPRTPELGQAITYQDPYNTWDVRNFILGVSDQPIEGYFEALSANIPGYSFTAIFVGSTFGWRIR